MTKYHLIAILINILIVVDIVLITGTIFLELPPAVEVGIYNFDFFTCLILLIQWFLELYNSKSKGEFLKKPSNWIDLIASIPFDAILVLMLPQLNILRYLKLLKLLRIMALFTRFFNILESFIKTTHMDKIIGVIIFTILIFTLVLWIWGPTYGLFEDFYFVVVTLSTVGYGDVVPETFSEKVIALVLIVVGVFVFSTITAVISSYFTNQLIESEGISTDEINELKSELKSIHDENSELKREIFELKEMIKNNK